MPGYQLVLLLSALVLYSQNLYALSALIFMLLLAYIKAQRANYALKTNLSGFLDPSQKIKYDRSVDSETKEILSSLRIQVDNYLNYSEPKETTEASNSTIKLNHLQTRFGADAIFFCFENDQQEYVIDDLEVSNLNNNPGEAAFAKELELIGKTSEQISFSLSDFKHTFLPNAGFKYLNRFTMQHVNGKAELWFAYTRSNEVSLPQQLEMRTAVADYTKSYLLGQQIDKLKTKVISSRNNNMQKSKFISGLSHDLRSPVNNLQAIITCLNDSNEKEEDGELLGLAKSNLGYLKTLVEDLLNLAKYRSGNLKPNYSNINLKLFLDDIVANHQFDAKLKKLELRTCNIDSDLNIKSDQNYLTRIVSNLIGNAIKYTSSGSIDLKIETDEKNLKISVIDTGLGLTKEQVERICVPFQRYNEAEAEGIGLGLAITKLLIEQLDGTLEIESVPNKGSEFSVILSLD